MAHFMQAVRMLQAEGRIHGRLSTRIYLLILAVLALLIITVYEIAQGATLVGALLSVLIGGALGYYLFERENPLQWNEEDALIEAKQLTVIGWMMIGLFIALKLILAVVLAQFLPAGGEAYLFAAFLGF